MVTLDPVRAARYRSMALAQPGCPFPEWPHRLLVVDVPQQRMGLLVDGQLLADLLVSTAANGIGNREGSYCTPPGWHRIHGKFGDGEPLGRVFRSRVATEDRWHGEARSEDLILTRILTLEGLEAGLNQGAGVDSLERYIYVHGTNQELRLGQPVSHGCVRVGNGDMVSLFDLVEVGDPLVVVPKDSGLGRLHFAGVGGSGMSALAQFYAMDPEAQGVHVSGSDRSFDRGQFPESRKHLEDLGIQLFPQDGSGVAGDCAGVVYSTAVEDAVPDIGEARRGQVPLIHRSELLAHWVAQHRTVAISGTSGKSTTTAMVFEILKGAGRAPSVITGGELRALQAEGLWGNALRTGSGLLVIEADESDGSLVRYRPSVGVVLNLQKDHKEEQEVAELFRVFCERTKDACVVGETANLEPFRKGARVFGFGDEAHVRAEHVHVEADGSRFAVAGVHFHLPVPGRHNVENALAAIAACQAVGVSLTDMVAPLGTFLGVARRFQILGMRRGVTVVDDFGHNPAKVAASLRTAKLRASRVLAVFQPHGYGPMRFLRQDFIAMFAQELGPEDRLWLLEVFYPGGSAVRDFSSADIVADMVGRGINAHFEPDRNHLVATVSKAARPGDLILLMGARDPSLTSLAHALYQAL